jgi:hypothetical protein
MYAPECCVLWRFIKLFFLRLSRTRYSGLLRFRVLELQFGTLYSEFQNLEGLEIRQFFLFSHILCGHTKYSRFYKIKLTGMNRSALKDVLKKIKNCSGDKNDNSGSNSLTS